MYLTMGDIKSTRALMLLGLAMGLNPDDLGMIKPKELKGISPFVSLDNLVKKVENIPLDDVEGGK